MRVIPVGVARGVLRDRVCRLRRAGRQLQKTMCQGNRVEYRAAEGEGPVPERAWSADRVSQVARVPWNPVRIRPDRWVSLNIPV